MPTILVVTDTGCEDACAKEIGMWLDTKPIVTTNIVSFEGSIQDACLLGYHLQTAKRVLLELAVCDDALPEPNKEILALITGTFKADGEVMIGDMLTQELVEKVGGWIHRHDKPVSLDAPDFVVYAVKTERMYVGLDVVGYALEKRDWRIMLSRRSLKATIAAAAAVYADVQPTQRILDPFGDDGTLAIETALLLAKMSPRRHSKTFTYKQFGQQIKDTPVESKKITVFHETVKDVNAIRVNSKLAGVEKRLHSTKVSLDWISAKMNDVDTILTYPITSGRTMPEKFVQKRNNELFKQAAEILKKNGTITCITTKPEELECAKAYKFNRVFKKTVWMGKLPMYIVRWTRGV